jgi:hypothetical protein
MKGIVMALQTSRSIPDLFSDAVGQLAKLIGNEFELARAELSEKARMVGNAAVLIGAGAVVMIPALMHAGLSDPVAYLLTGAGAAGLSAVLIWVGLNRLSGDALKPTVTLEQVKRDQMAAKEMVR